MMVWDLEAGWGRTREGAGGRYGVYKLIITVNFLSIEGFFLLISFQFCRLTRPGINNRSINLISLPSCFDSFSDAAVVF